MASSNLNVYWTVLSMRKNLNSSSTEKIKVSLRMSPAITYQRITEEMERLGNKSANDILCMRYCYSLLLRAEQQKKSSDNDDLHCQNEQNGTESTNDVKRYHGQEKLHGVKMHVYCEGKKDPVILGGGDGSISVNIAMGPNGIPVCKDEQVLVDKGIIKKEITCFFCGNEKKNNENKDKNSCENCKNQSVGEATKPVEIPEDAMKIICKPRISFRHICEAKANLATEYGLTADDDIASLNRCITYIEHQKAAILENATFIISCGNEVTIVLTAGKGKHVVEFAINEKRKPIVKEINDVNDGSFRPGACGAPHVNNIKEFGFTVLTEAVIDTLVADFQKWNLISENDKRLLLFVKKVFKDREGESTKAACPDIKTNALITIKCEKFDVMLKAGNCYNICKVYMEQSTPAYKCKRLRRWRRAIEKLSMINAGDILKDVKVGPFRLRFDDEETCGKDEDDDGDKEANSDNDYES